MGKGRGRNGRLRESGGARVSGGWRQEVLFFLPALPGSVSLTLTLLISLTRRLVFPSPCPDFLSYVAAWVPQRSLEIQAKPLRHPPRLFFPLPRILSCQGCAPRAVLPGLPVVSRHWPPWHEPLAPFSGCRLGGGLGSEHVESHEVLKAVQSSIRKG